MDAVFRLSEATGNDRLVLLAIADEANDDGCNAYPGIPLIAAKVRLPERTVRRCLDRLDELGELHRIQPEKRGRGHFTRYEVLVGKEDTLSSTKGGHKGAEGGQKEAEKGRKVDTPPPLTSADAEYPGPLPETQDPERKEPTQALALVSAETDASLGFEAFWEVYPKRNGKKVGRRICEQQWARLSLADRRAAWRGAVHYADSVDRGLTIAKDPERFLKHRVWEDWQEPAPGGVEVLQPATTRRPSVVERSFHNIARGPKHGIR